MKRQIKVKYTSIDRCRKAGTFGTLRGAQKFAQRWVGRHPEIGEVFQYAVCANGVGKVTVQGATLAELFPGHGDGCDCEVPDNDSSLRKRGLYENGERIDPDSLYDESTNPSNGWRSP